VGFFNLESEQVTLSLTLLNAAGDGGKVEFYTLEPNEMDQINDVFDWAGLTDPDGGVYTLLIDGNGDVLTFVSVIDNLSNDPVFQPGELREIGSDSPAACVDIPLPAADTVANYEIQGLQDNPFGGDPITVYPGSTSEVTYNSATDSSADTTSENEVYTSISPTDPINVIENKTTDHRILEEPAGYAEQDRVETSIDSALFDQEIVETFSPALLFGPLTRACAGDTWSLGPVTETTQIVGGDTTTESYTWEGEVLTVDAEYTSDEGIHTAVHWRASRTSGDGQGMSTERMYDVETGILLYRLDKDSDGITVLLEQKFAEFGER